MRPLHEASDAKAIYSNESLLAIVAGLCAREIMDISSLAGALVLRENCRLIRVILSIVYQLAACGTKTKRLILMELPLRMIVDSTSSWDGQVGLLWGVDSFSILL